MRLKISKITLNVALAVMGLLTLYPFAWMLASSFKSNAEINAFEQTFFPVDFTFENYISMNTNFDFVRFFTNSLFIAIVTTAIICYTSTISGFVLSKYKFKGRDVIFSFILATMMIPWAVTIIPRYTIVRELQWIDSYIALIVPAIFSGFGIFMLRQYCSTIPDDLIEAARIDGVNEFSLFHKIIFPLCKNAISSIAIFQFLWAWEDFLWPFIIISSEEKQLLSVGLKLFKSRYSVDYGGLFAASVISIIPVVIVYIIFQKRFVEGITASGVKG